jgi:hypothetical protein
LTQIDADTQNKGSASACIGVICGQRSFLLPVFIALLKIIVVYGPLPLDTAGWMGQSRSNSEVSGDGSVPWLSGAGMVEMVSGLG